MKKFLFLQIFIVLSLAISCVTPLYGAGEFSKHYNKGIEFYKQGKYDQAGKSFEAAIKIKPNDVYALYGLGNTHYCKAKYDDAVKIYTRAININPDYAKVHYSLSLAYSKLGRTGEAEKEKAIFRQLSQGGKSGKKTKTRVKSSQTRKGHKKSLQADSTLKKTLTKTRPERRAPTRTTSKKEEVKPKAKKSVSKVQKAPATSTRRSTKKDDSHSIFKGYTGETQKTDKRAFSKKYKEKYGISTGSFDNIKLYIQEKWYSSRLNKIWICIAGYVLATQIWLCAVTFFVLIIWRIREKT
ncbi:MAG: Cell division coordinator CpoB [Candidatus Scalindua arabica]|uniref:Cell division coordinator CpoB n=1 Tax=Candidatus Scalindua arabica TaxID=1127984 RepID=A0A941W456_9BACT|nr:Cell division coordinator CpoB [Candidatus Scalindua arabica]